jgi:hypothetical protein
MPDRGGSLTLSCQLRKEIAKITMALKERSRKFQFMSFSFKVTAVILNICSVNEIIVGCGCKRTQH